MQGDLAQMSSGVRATWRRQRPSDAVLAREHLETQEAGRGMENLSLGAIMVDTAPDSFISDL